MADLGTQPRALGLRLQILLTLSLLPIKNKTIISDSKVLSIVRKWAEQIAIEKPSDKSESGTEVGSEQSSGDMTPSRPECTSSPVSQKLNTVKSADLFLSKKKRFLRRALEDSSSDSELSESSRVSGVQPGSTTYSSTDNLDRSGKDTELSSHTENCSLESTLEDVDVKEGNTTATSSGENKVEGRETKEDSGPDMEKVSNVAASLLDSWKDLKVSLIIFVAIISKCHK